ncbi:hypothetical protein K9F62_16500 [Desulfovibrio sp. JY]|nr:hypothetical protein K9F62_16500 [Desulfovibrio sp. JY]
MHACFSSRPVGRLMRLFMTALVLAGLVLPLTPGQALAAKVDTRAFSAFFSGQSAKIYDHLLKVTDYYTSLVKEGNTERIKDVLALRASLSACWEIFLNAGDMIFVYNQLDTACPVDVDRMGGLIHTGLGIIAGKLDKELEWMGLTEKNVGDLPVSVELTQARRDIAAAATYFRQAATLFPEAGSGGQTRQPVSP